jgi:class 3 adenylate cyclase
MTTTRATSYARSADGGYVGYQTMGSGAVDLLIGSYGSISIDSFDELPQLAHFLDSLASFARLVLFDWRGVGLSDPLPDDPAPTLAHSPADVLAVLDAIAADDAPAALLAWLNSGPTAVTLAAEQPDRLHALLLVNTLAKLVRAPGYEFGISRATARSFDEDVIDPSGTGGEFEVVRMHAPSMVADESFVRWWENGGRRGASPSTAHRFMRGLAAADVRELLPAVTVPTLVLHARDVGWYNVENGRYLATHIPGAKLVELPSADMTVFSDAAELAVEEIEEFLTGERHVHEPARELMTVLFTDIVDSTRQVATLGDREWRRVLDEYERMAEREVRRFRGRVVKTTGDGMLAVFDSPARAIRCATTIAAQSTVEMRAGLHTGEVELRGADVGGFAVHVGQRVSAAARAGEVLVSRTVSDLVAGSGFEFDDRGEHDLRGIPGHWQLYAVRAGGT